MAFPSVLINPTTLNNNLDQRIVILDCTIDKIGQSLKHKKPELIPNSLFFDIEGKFSDIHSKLPHTLVDQTTFEREVQELGIHQDTIIVLYDRWGIYSSPRAWWMFKVMGFEQVYVLNGGLPLWKKQNFPVSANYISAAEKGTWKSSFRPEWYADKGYILANYKNPHTEIIDARSKGRFVGLVPEPRKGLNGGHIPHSKNLPFEEVLDGLTFKSASELMAIFDHLTGGAKEYIFSCGSGITASIVALASYVAGYRPIRVYDGSWSEWGTEELNLPIEK